MSNVTMEASESTIILSLSEKSPEQQTARFRANIEELRGSAGEIALRISRLGDLRSPSATLRSIQRMLSGESRVSGEMQALMTMMLSQQRRLQKKYESLTWEVLQNGAYSALTEGFRITLFPRTRGRWSVDLVHIETGCSHPWPDWQTDLDKAKFKAMLSLEEAIDFKFETDRSISSFGKSAL